MKPVLPKCVKVWHIKSINKFHFGFRVEIVRPEHKKPLDFLKRSRSEHVCKIIVIVNNYQNWNFLKCQKSNTELRRVNDMSQKLSLDWFE